MKCSDTLTGGSCRALGAQGDREPSLGEGPVRGRRLPRRESLVDRGEGTFVSLSEGTACAKAGALVGVTGLWTGRLCVAQILNREQWWSPGLLMGVRSAAALATSWRQVPGCHAGLPSPPWAGAATAPLRDKEEQASEPPAPRLLRPLWSLQAFSCPSPHRPPGSASQHWEPRPGPGASQGSGMHFPFCFVLCPCCALAPAGGA